MDTQISASVTVDTVAEDDIINAKEAEQDITITGTVGGDAKEGDIVIVDVNGNKHDVIVGEGGRYELDVPASEFKEGDNEITASVTITDAAGNTTTAESSKNVSIDTEVDGDLAGEVSSNDNALGQSIVVDSITLEDGASYNMPESGKISLGDSDNPYGSFTLNADGQLVFTQNTAYQHPEGADSFTTQVQIPVVDAHGNDAFATVDVTIGDSAPEISASSDKELTVEDNVATGNITVDFGADMDGATITLGGGGTFPAGVEYNAETGTWDPLPFTWNVTSTYHDGVYTIKIGDVTMTSTDNQNWEVSYKHNDSDRDITIDFTDSDGDKTSHTMSTNDAPTAGTSSAELSESELESGSITTNGQVDLDYGMNGEGSFTWNAEGQPQVKTSDGQEITWEVDGNVLKGMAGGEEAITVTIDPSTGEYTVEMNQSIEHDAQGADSENLEFGFSITDADGDSAEGSISVSVEDSVTAQQDTVIDLGSTNLNIFGGGADASDLESALRPNADQAPTNSWNSGGWAGAFYDNQSADKSSIEVDGFTISGAIVKYDPESGHSVDQNADNLILGWRVDNSTADGVDYGNGIGMKGQGGGSDYEVGNIKGDYTSGTVETEAIIITLPEGQEAYGIDLSFSCLCQAGQNNADVNSEMVTIEFFHNGELVYTVQQLAGTADTNQNFDTSTLTVPFDEVRIIPTHKGSDFVLNGVDFSDYAYDIVGQGAGQIDGGVDGLSDAYFTGISVGESTVDFSRDAQGNITIDGDATLTLEDGTEVTLVYENGVVIATDAEGTPYFTASVDNQGTWTMYQQQPFGDQIQMELGSVDGDGDVQNHTITMNGNDAPTVGEATSVEVFESALADGTNAESDGEVATGHIDLDFGANGEGSFAWNAEGQPEVQGGSGENITWVTEGNVLKGMDGDTEVITVTMDPSTGNYTVELKEGVDHDSVSGDLNFGFSITDADGDMAAGSINVGIVDDGISMESSTGETVFAAQFDSTTATATAEGNLNISGGDARELSVSFSGENGEASADKIEIDGTILTIVEMENEDGTSTFKAGIADGNGAIPDPYFTVDMNPETGEWEFTQIKEFESPIKLEITASDVDGDTASATQTIEVTPSKDVDGSAATPIVDDFVSINEGATAKGNLFSSEADTLEDPTIVSFETPEGWMLTNNDDGSFTLSYETVGMNNTVDHYTIIIQPNGDYSYSAPHYFDGMELLDINEVITYNVQDADGNMHQSTVTFSSNSASRENLLIEGDFTDHSVIIINKDSTDGTSYEYTTAGYEDASTTDSAEKELSAFILGDTNDSIEVTGKVGVGEDGISHHIYGDELNLNGVDGGHDTITVGELSAGGHIRGDGNLKSGADGGDDEINVGTMSSNSATSSNNSESSRVIGDGWNIYGGSKGGDDTITFTGRENADGSVTNEVHTAEIYGDAETLQSGTSTSYAQGGDDTFNMENTTVTGANIYGDAKIMGSFAEGGDDAINLGTMNSGTLSGDAATMYTNSVAGNDTIDVTTMKAGTLVGDASGIMNAGSQGGADNIDVTTMHNGTVLGDATTLNNGAVGGDDNITITTMNNGMVSGEGSYLKTGAQGGDDTITISDMNLGKVRGDVHTINADASGGDDVINVGEYSGTGTTGSTYISGDAYVIDAGGQGGDDTINLGDMNGQSVYGDAGTFNGIGGDDVINVTNMNSGSITGDGSTAGSTSVAGDDLINIENMSGGYVYGDSYDEAAGAQSGSDTIEIGTMSGGEVWADQKAGSSNDGGDDVVSVVNFTEGAKAYLDGGEGYDAFIYDNDFDNYIDFDAAGSMSIGGHDGVTINNFESLTTGGGNDLISVDGASFDGHIDSGAGFDVIVSEGGLTSENMSDILNSATNTEMFIFSNDASVNGAKSTEEAMENLEGVEMGENGKITLGENWTAADSPSGDFQAFTDADDNTILIAKNSLETTTY